MQAHSSEAKMLREFDDREEFEHILIGCDIAQACAGSQDEINRLVEALIEALCYVSPSACDAMISQLAHIHGYAHLLDESPGATGPVELTTTTNPTANVPTGTNGSSSQRAASSRPAGSVSASTSTK
jgi:hypothetical protein